MEDYTQWLEDRTEKEIELQEIEDIENTIDDPIDC